MQHGLPHGEGQQQHGAHSADGPPASPSPRNRCGPGCRWRSRPPRGRRTAPPPPRTARQRGFSFWFFAWGHSLLQWFFPQATKKLPSPFCPGWTEKTKEQPSAVPLFLRFQNDGNALCGYGPAAWPAGYPCVANGRNPVRAYLLRHGRSAVSSARGLLNASHQPASLWQGPCAYYSASSRCLLDKIAQPAPLCQPLF